MRPTVLRIRTSVLIVIFSFAAFASRAQSLSYGKVELGAGIGPLFFLGDLGGNMGRGTTLIKDINVPTTNISFGAFLNVYPTEWLGFRLAFNHGQLEGADSLVNEKGGDESFRKARNLHFKSPMTEAYAAIELYPTVFLEQYDGLAGKFRPYGLIGIGAFKFNPQTQYYSPNGTVRWVELKPLMTEGEGMSEYPTRKEYKLTQLEVPMGVGFKYYLTDNMHIGIELLHRKTFTDYIDDVSTDYINPSLFDKYLAPEDAVVAKQVNNRAFGVLARSVPGDQRGQPKNNDAFFSTLLRFGWRIAKEPATPSYMRCPRF